MIKKVFLWKPTKVKGKWKWLCFANKKETHKYICIEGKMVQMTVCEYSEVK